MKQVNEFYESKVVDHVHSAQGVQNATNSGVDVESITYYPGTGSDLAPLVAGQIFIQWTMTAGGVAIQSYARVTWRPTRDDKSNTLPGNITSARIQVSSASGLPTVDRILSLEPARELANDINLLPLLSTEPRHSCLPASGSDRLTFTGSGRSYQVTITGIDFAPGCDDVKLGFGVQRDLEGGYQIHQEIVKLLGLSKSYAGASAGS